MSSRKNRIELAVVAVVFLITVGAYFKFTDRGRHSIVIPETDAFLSSGQISGLVSKLEIDFDELENRKDPSAFIEGNAYTGNFANVLDKEREFSQGIEHKWLDIKLFGAVKEIKFSFWCFSKSSLTDVIAVYSVDSLPGKSIDWQSLPVLTTESGKWVKISLTFPVNAVTLHRNNIFKLYIWNRSKQEFLVDDFSVEFYANAFNGNPNKSLFTIRSEVNGFELIQGSDSANYTSGVAHSGKYSYQLKSGSEYSPAVSRKIAEITSASLSQISMGVWIFPQEEKLDAVLVVSIKKPNGNEYVWEGKSTDNGRFEKGKWTKHRAQFKLPAEKISKDDIISAYVWDKAGTQILIDDLEVVFGEQQSRMGGDPLVDMAVVPEEGFAFQKNKPPFRTMWLSPVFGLDAAMGKKIFPDRFSRLVPSDLIASGRFIKNNALNQIVLIEDSLVELYSFCDGENQFRLFFSGILPFISDNTNLNIIDLNGDKKDELFLTDKKGNGHIIQLPGAGIACTKVPASVNLDSWFDFKIQDPASNDSINNLRFLGIDRNHDGRSELLIWNKATGLTEIVEATGQLIAISKVNGKWLPEKSDVQFLLWDGSSITNSGRLFCLLSDANGQTLASYVWDQKQQLFNNSGTNDFVPLSLIEKGCEFIAPGTTADHRGNLLLYNKQFRFDLKKLNFDKSGFAVEYRMDFRDTDQEHNPKFFESSKIVTGNFMSSSKWCLFTISADCAAVNQMEGNCRVFETQGRIGLFAAE